MNPEEGSILERIAEKLGNSLKGIEQALDDIHELEVRIFKGDMKEDTGKSTPLFERSGVFPQVEEYIERVDYLTSQISEHKNFFM